MSRIEEVTFIYNPKSGLSKQSDLRSIIRARAKALGRRVTWYEISALQSGGALAREAIAGGATCIVACGGDGTVREVLEAVKGTKAHVGIVPLGTGNILALNLGIPVKVAEAVDVALTGSLRAIDVGEANGRTFGMTASMGIPVEVMASTRQKDKQRWGLLAYLFAAWKKLRKPTTLYRIRVDGSHTRIVRAMGIVATNVGATVGGVVLAPGAHARSGDLRLAIIRARYASQWLDLLFNALRGKINQSQYYEILPARSLEIRPVRGRKAYECDGTQFEKTSRLTIQLWPKSVWVRVPRVATPAATRPTIIFDFDGTLADTFGRIAEIYNYLAKKHGLAVLSDTEIEAMRHVGAREAVSRLHIPPLKIPTLIKEGREQLITHIDSVELFSGLRTQLQVLAKTAVLGIVTSNDEEVVRAFLKVQKLELFDFVFSERTLFGKGKLLKDVMKSYGIDARAVWYVGDEVRDIEAAREAGIRVASVTWGFNSERVLGAASPDLLLYQPKDLELLLKKHSTEL